MLPRALLRYSVRDGAVAPHYLDERDHPWLRALLDEYDRFVGRPRRALDERLKEPLPRDGPPGKRALAVHVLDRLYRARTQANVPPPAARAAVFAAAAREVDRATALDRSARELRVSCAALEASLFADVPGERAVAPLARPVGPPEVALRANLALAQGLLQRSTRVVIEVAGNARAVVRHAKLRGLLLTVLARGGPARRAALEISGPLSILRRTLVYGRALGELLPLLAWCPAFRLRATCVLGGRELRYAAGPGDPLLPAGEPRRHDSRLEERFARELARLAPGWDVIREPEPVEAGGKLIFPDFLVRERAAPGRRFLVEVAGFWTAAYLERKLADLRAAGLEGLILCVDEDRAVSPESVPQGARVVRFRRRIDPAAVLAAAGVTPAPPPPGSAPRGGRARSGGSSRPAGGGPTS